MDERRRGWLVGLALEYVQGVFDQEAALYNKQIFDCDFVTVRAGLLQDAWT
jgi:hypothetical protein